MVSKVVKVGRLFSWSRNFSVDQDEGIVEIIVHVDDREYHFVPDAETIDRLKAIRDRVKAIMAEDVEVSGEITEVWGKQMVQYPSYEVEEYVRIQ